MTPLEIVQRVRARGGTVGLDWSGDTPAEWPRLKLHVRADKPLADAIRACPVRDLMAGVLEADEREAIRDEAGRLRGTP